MSVGFPLLLIPLAICNIIIFLMPGVSFATPLVTLTLMSGAAWPITLSDGLLAVGMLLLLLEVMKARRPGAKYFTDHFLSLIVFGGAAAEFLLLPQFGTSTFFLLSLIALVDFLAGIALLPRRPRRVVAEVPVAPPVRVAPAIEPHFEPVPVPAPPVPAAASVAEAVLLDRPAPVPDKPDVVAHDASPRVASPDLQPGSGAHPSPDAPPAR